MTHARTQRPWDAEHAPDRALAHELATALCPEIAGLPFELLGSGWDVDVWCAGDLAFRFPRRPLGAACVENELRVLPALAGRIPLEIPVPYAVGRPTPRFPHVHFAHVLVRGTPVDRARLSPEARARLGVPLARTLRALHAVSAAEARSFGAKPDTLRRDLGVVGERALASLTLLEREPWSRLVPELRAFLGKPPRAHTGPVRLIHGDVYARHLILDTSTRRLFGLIDWGDACLGDAAVDLGVAYTVLPPAAREAFWSSYGGADSEMRERARFLGISRHAVQVLAYAIDRSDPVLAHEAGFALENALG